MTVMSEYRVSRHRSIVAPPRGRDQRGAKLPRVFKPGERIPEGVFDRETLREHLQSGFLIKANAGPADDRETTGEVRALNPTAEFESMDEARAKLKDGGEPLPMDVLAPATGGTEKLRPKSLWDLDPDGLAGKSLEELNALVIDRDVNMEPFDTVEEAIGQLSLHFVASK